MRGHLANLLLLVGTVLGGIAGANSAKASRRLALEADAYPGEFVARDVAEPAAPATPGPALLVTAGSELTADVVAALRSAGRDEVDVKDPPIDHEVLGGSDRAAALGRILAKAVKLGEKDEEIPAGRRVTAVLLQRCAAAGIATLEIERDGARETIPTAALKAPADLPPAELAARQKKLDLEFAALATGAAKDARVASAFTLHEDEALQAGTFLDAPAVDRIVAAGVETIDVRIVKGFVFRGWEQRWLYLAALLAMVAGVVVKRAGGKTAGGEAPGGGLSAAEVRRRIGALADKLADLAERADGLDARALHAALDPLLAEDVYTIVESRAAVAAKLGPAGFVAVFGPFASAERYLNRAWSAAVDGYAEEARDALRRGADGLVATVQAYPRS